MDRTGWAVVAACLLALLGWQAYLSHRYPTPIRSRPTATNAVINSPAPGPTPDRASAPVLRADPPAPQTRPVEEPTSEETTLVLENNYVRATVTSSGGGLKKVELKQHEGEKGQRVTLNTGSPEPVFNLSGWEEGSFLKSYTLTSEGETVVARRTLANGVEVERRYHLTGDYLVGIQQTLKNPSAQPLILPAYRLNVGSAGPLHVHDQPMYVKSGWFQAASQHFSVTMLPDFEASSFLFGLFGARPARDKIIGEQTGLQWVSVKNQFFALILTPLTPPLAEKAESDRITLPKNQRVSAIPHGIQAAAWFPKIALDGGTVQTQDFQLYAGPKEYSRLKALPHREEVAMEFGFWSWVVKPLLGSLKWLHEFVPNYGLVIVALTFLIKLALSPLQSMANSSMKKMQALAPKMKELQEKYKEEPQKLNKEMMKLYQDYGVNPVGGCLPLMLQMPIFLGFYTMLQSAVELRNQSFLWIHDLSQPDTIAQFPLLGFNLDINPLPIIMTATTVLLMRMSPQSSDNPQMKMMQWMPVLFIFFLYNFASALALYWTINNLFSIGQTYYNLRQPVPTLKKVAKQKS